MVVNRVPGSKRARVEKLNQINCFFLINFQKVGIVVDVLMETSNEFLQQKMPPSRFAEHKVRWYEKIGAFFFGGQVAPKVFWLIRSQVSENKCAYFQLPM